MATQPSDGCATRDHGLGSSRLRAEAEDCSSRLALPVADRRTGRSADHLHSCRVHRWLTQVRVCRGRGVRLRMWSRRVVRRGSNTACAARCSRPAHPTTGSRSVISACFHCCIGDVYGPDSVATSRARDKCRLLIPTVTTASGTASSRSQVGAGRHIMGRPRPGRADGGGRRIPVQLAATRRHRRRCGGQRSSLRVGCREGGA